MGQSHHNFNDKVSIACRRGRFLPGAMLGTGSRKVDSWPFVRPFVRSKERSIRPAVGRSGEKDTSLSLYVRAQLAACFTSGGESGGGAVGGGAFFRRRQSSINV